MSEEHEFRFADGERIADFTIRTPIDYGAFGDVYLVSDLTGTELALKFLTGDARREMESVACLRKSIGNESGLAAIHHVGEFEGHTYYTMDLADNVPGSEKYCPDTLENRLALRGALNVFEVLDIAESLIKAISALHDHGLVHCDIKPGNVIFRGGKALLADFGLVCGENESRDSGTIGFIPPEGIADENFEKRKLRDFYALGKVIYCALTNESADRFPILPKNYSLQDVAVMRKIYVKACASDPDARYKSGDEFLKAVKDARKELAIGVRSSGWRRLLPLASGVLAVIATLFSLFMVFRRPDGDDVYDTTVYARISEESGSYQVFCCFNAGEDQDPRSVANQRKAATLVTDALGKYRKTEKGLTVKVYKALYFAEPECCNGVLVYRYEIPVNACREIRRE